MLKGLLSISFISLLLLSSCGGDKSDFQIGNKTTLKVKELFAAGDVIKGEIVKAEFTIENTGDYPLVIGAVNVSCSCTVTDKPSEPIAPGETAVIKAFVNTVNLPIGKIKKKVSIVANTEPSVTDVLITGNVKRK